MKDPELRAALEPYLGYLPPVRDRSGLTPEESLNEAATELAYMAWVGLGYDGEIDLADMRALLIENGRILEARANAEREAHFEHLRASGYLDPLVWPAWITRLRRVDWVAVLGVAWIILNYLILVPLALIVMFDLEWW